jgi:hypothetical protein
MKRSAITLIAVALSLSLTTSAAWAASYRDADLERAIVKEFKRGHGGTRGSDTKWRCRVRRADKRRSTPFVVTISSAGKWKAATFRFPGFSGRYALHGCCIKRR